MAIYQRVNRASSVPACSVATTADGASVTWYHGDERSIFQRFRLLPPVGIKVSIKLRDSNSPVEESSFRRGNAIKTPPCSATTFQARVLS